MENGKKPAFSVALIDNGNATHPVAMGLTKREYFAAMAMQAIISRPTDSNNAESRARLAVVHADELLKALETKSE